MTGPSQQDPGDPADGGSRNVELIAGEARVAETPSGLDSDDARHPFDEPAEELRIGRRELALRLGRAALAGAFVHQNGATVHRLLLRYALSYGGSRFYKRIALWLARHWFPRPG